MRIRIFEQIKETSKKIFQAMKRVFHENSSQNERPSTSEYAKSPPIEMTKQKLMNSE